MNKLPLSELLAGIPSGDDPDEPSYPQPEAQIMELTQMRDRYVPVGGDCPYSSGDWVTPAKSANIKGDGNPMLVIEAKTQVPVTISPNETHTDNTYGVVLDMRVAAVTPGGTIFRHWVESCDFIPYTG